MFLFGPKKIDPAQIQVSTQELCIFTRQFECMLAAGVPLLRALEYYADSDPTTMGKVIDGVAETVRGGATLSKGMSRYPKVFSPLFVGLVRSGEGTGALQGMLEKMVEVLERQGNLIGKFKAAITYPIVVMIVAFLVFLGFIYVILPALAPMLTSVHVVAPWPTRVLIGLGIVLRTPAIMALVVVLCINVWAFGPKLLQHLRKDEARRIMIDRMPLEIPAFGPLLRRILVSRILFALSTTVDSGLSLTHSLHLAQGITGNAYIADQLQKVHKCIADGSSLAEGLGETTLFLNGVVQMVAVGEETSSLSTSLMYVAKLYDELAEESINSGAALIEPVLMVSMGLVAGFLILATILPLVKMLQSL